MNKGKVWLVVGVVLIAGYAGATWLTGQMTHQRMDEFVARMGEQFKGQVHVVDRKSTRGFFSSTEDITLAVDNPVYKALLNNGNSPRQLTIHNEIAHGPLPGFKTVGVAQVESSLLLTDDERKQLKELLGTDKPLAFAVTLGWLGGTHIAITSPVMAVNMPQDGAKLNWQGMDVGIDYSKNFANMTVKGTAPGIKVTDKSGMELSFDKLQVTADLKRQFESLYVGDEDFTVASVTVTQPASNSNVTIKDIAYRIKMGAQGDFFSAGAKLGASSVDSTQIKVKDVHFDFVMNHLHGPTLNQLFKAYQELSTQLSNPAATKVVNTESVAAKSLTETDPPARETAETQLAKIKPHLIELLKHDPEMTIEHVGFATDNGALKLTGHAQFEQLVADDFEPELSTDRILKKLAVTADITLPQSLVDHWPVGMTPDAAHQLIAQLEKQGLIVRKGDEWQSHLEYMQGALTANGKKVGPQE
jgi:uncharacterized protein YdgA (DUF945 family)